MEGGALDTLNAEQRQAVEYGISSGEEGPLLIIAGAGSGKTNTLAHRVAHILSGGIDPNRVLLLTFSRRAAQEMRRRVEGLASRTLDSTGKIGWAGTFHAIGAKLLRIYARQIDLNPAFTILDRSDAEDALNLVRHELGFSTTESRFPTKATCLSIYSRAVNAALHLAILRLQNGPKN
jgi:DNA helicase-2/ATP-dependent DNA helicase PcrA